MTLTSWLVAGSSMDRGTEPSAAWCRTTSTPAQAAPARRPVADVALHELEALRRDRAEASSRLRRWPVDEVVEDADLAGRATSSALHEVGADEAGPSGDEPGPRADRRRNCTGARAHAFTRRQGGRRPGRAARPGSGCRPPASPPVEGRVPEGVVRRRDHHRVVGREGLGVQGTDFEPQVVLAPLAGLGEVRVAVVDAWRRTPGAAR